MSKREWFGLLAGAIAGVAIAWTLRRYGDYAPVVTETQAEIRI